MNNQINVTLAKSLVGMVPRRRLVLETIASARENGIEWEDVPGSTGIPDAERYVRKAFTETLNLVQTHDPASYAELAKLYGNDLDRWLIDVKETSFAMSQINKKQEVKAEAVKVATPTEAKPQAVPPIVLEVLAFLVETLAAQSQDLGEVSEDPPHAKKFKRLARRGRELHTKLAGYAEAFR